MAKPRYTLPQGTKITSFEQAREFFRIYAGSAYIEEVTDNFPNMYRTNYIQLGDIYCYVDGTIVREYYLNHMESDDGLRFVFDAHGPDIYKVTAFYTKK